MIDPIISHRRDGPKAMLLCLLLLSGSGPGGPSSPRAQGRIEPRPGSIGMEPPRYALALDHVSIAVSDLASARRSFEALGFTVKPGQLHESSILNVLLEFRDGTEIELITASEPRGALAREYLDLVAEGDGAAFLALRSPRIDRLYADLQSRGEPVSLSRSGRLPALTFPEGHRLHPLWIVGLARRLEEDPGFLVHPNSAVGLAAVWLAPWAAEEVLPFFGDLGYRTIEPPGLGEGFVAVPIGLGNLTFVNVAVPAGDRFIVGVSIEVSSIEAVESTLRAADIEAERRADDRGNSVLVPPGLAHGIWLEFLETSGSSSIGVVDPAITNVVVPQGVVTPRNEVENRPGRRGERRGDVEESPRVVVQGEGSYLFLPVPMGRVLNELDDPFETRHLSDYPPSILEEYELDDRQAPFAVIGDFNGDGIKDVVIDGDSPGTGRRLVILSRTENEMNAGGVPGVEGEPRAGGQEDLGGAVRFEVIEVERIPALSDTLRRWRFIAGEPPPAGTRLPGEGVDQGLRLITPRELASPFEEEPLRLETDAFEVRRYGKGAAVYYYKDGTFQKYVTDD